MGSGSWDIMRSIKDYEAIIGRDEVRSILRLAKRVYGAKVIHVNATAYGGGVAEILKNLIPLAQSVGLKAKWEVIKGDPEFFKITKAIHNALQGSKEIRLTEEMKDHYIMVAKKNIEYLDLEGDVVIIHDPQPLPLVDYRGKNKWIWRCHIDLSDPNPEVWGFIRRYVIKFDAAVFTLERYIPDDIKGLIRTYVRYPAIDPLSDKNKPLPTTTIVKILERFGIDPERPIIGQVSRFDPWKDPLGVIDVYRKVKKRIKDVQLVMIGCFAHDDPEGYEWYRKTMDYANGDRDIHILTNMDGVSDLEVNAFQRAFTVALQLSRREGFGLSVTEALWKGVPVVARRAGGIPLQVINGVTGYLINGIESASRKVTLLIRRPWLARLLGEKGREHVRRNFLITKLLKDYLRMHIDLVGI